MELLSKRFTEEVDSEILHGCTSASRDELLNELQIAEILDNSKGCRKKENIKTANKSISNGLNAFFTCTGFCIRLREELYSESQTKVILDAADAMTCNISALKYYERLEAFGYDFNCRLFYTLMNCFKYNQLTQTEQKFWWPILVRLFIDIFHISTHVDDLCKNINNGLFHPKLKKFKNIFKDDELLKRKRINDQIVEQFWSTFNKYTYMRALSREKFKFFLYLKREQHNLHRIEALSKKGYIFIDIDDTTTLRVWDAIQPSIPTISSCKTLKELHKKYENEIQKLRQKFDACLQTVKIGSQNINKYIHQQVNEDNCKSIICIADSSMSQPLSQYSSRLSSQQSDNSLIETKTNNNNNKTKLRKQKIKKKEKNKKVNQNNTKTKKKKKIEK